MTNSLTVLSGKSLLLAIFATVSSILGLRSVRIIAKFTCRFQLAVNLQYFVLPGVCTYLGMCGVQQLSLART